MGDKKRVFPQSEINKMMQLLDISKEEAIQLLNDDADDYIGEEGEKFQEKAKEVTKKHATHERRKERKPRERKVDCDKAVIYTLLLKTIEDDSQFDNVAGKPETEIKFNFKDEEYSIKITKHRKK